MRHWLEEALQTTPGQPLRGCHRHVRLLQAASASRQHHTEIREQRGTSGAPPGPWLQPCRPSQAPPGRCHAAPAWRVGVRAAIRCMGSLRRWRGQLAARMPPAMQWEVAQLQQLCKARLVCCAARACWWMDTGGEPLISPKAASPSDTQPAAQGVAGGWRAVGWRVSVDGGQDISTERSSRPASQPTAGQMPSTLPPTVNNCSPVRHPHASTSKCVSALSRRPASPLARPHPQHLHLKACTHPPASTLKWFSASSRRPMRRSDLAIARRSDRAT